MSSRPLAVVFLVAVNLVPLVGVLFFGWSLFSLMLLYWFESGIVGFFNVLKILRASGPAPENQEFTINERPANPANKWFIAPFFVLHYGIFWTVHGVFVFLVFGLGVFDVLAPDRPSGFSGGLRGFEPVGVAVAAAAMLLSHGVSFFVNFLGKREYLAVSPMEQMSRPYSRVFVLHVTVLAGACLTAFLGTPLAALVVMVFLKTAFDLRAHLREHRAAEENVPA